jgi:hypothetical protein
MLLTQAHAGYRALHRVQTVVVPRLQDPRWRRQSKISVLRSSSLGLRLYSRVRIQCSGNLRCLVVATDAVAPGAQHVVDALVGLLGGVAEDALGQNAQADPARPAKRGEVAERVGVGDDVGPPRLLANPDCCLNSLAVWRISSIQSSSDQLQ